MKKLIIKSLAIALCMFLSVSMLGACSNDPTEDDKPVTTPPATTPAPTPEPEPEEIKITDGYFFYQGPTTGDLPCFIRFNEDGTFYALFFNGGVIEAGLWELVDKNMEFIDDPGPDGAFGTADDIMATANQVMILTNFTTGAKQEIAFHEGRLRDFTFGGMSPHNSMDHIHDFDYDPAVMEMPFPIQVFYYQFDVGASLTLYHNLSFNDFTTAGEFGTWVMEGGKYILTTSDGLVYTLTVSENGLTATYEKGSEVLELTSSPSAIMFSFTAETQPEGLPMAVDVTINCMPDGTAVVIMSSPFFDDIPIDSGTFVIEHMVFITFEFVNAGTIVGEPDFDTATESGITIYVPFVAEVDLGDGNMLLFDAELEGILS